MYKTSTAEHVVDDATQASIDQSRRLNDVDNNGKICPTSIIVNQAIQLNSINKSPISPILYTSCDPTDRVEATIGDIMRKNPVPHSSLSENLLDAPIKNDASRFNYYDSVDEFDNHGVEYVEIDKLKRAGGIADEDTLENVMGKHFIVLIIEANHNSFENWKKAKIGSFVDPISRDTSVLTIEKYLSFTPNSSGQNALKNLYQKLLMISNQDTFDKTSGLTRQEALSLVPDYQWTKVINENVYFKDVKFELIQQLMYKIQARVIGNLMLDIGPNRVDEAARIAGDVQVTSWYHAVQEWMQFDPAYSHRIFVVGNEGARGTDKIVLLKFDPKFSDEWDELSSKLARIEYKSWDQIYDGLFYKGSKLDIRTASSLKNPNDYALVGFISTKSDIINSGTIPTGSLSLIPDYAFASLDPITSRKYAILNENLGNLNPGDGVFIMMPSLKGRGFGFIDRLPRDAKSYGLGTNIKVNGINYKIGTNFRNADETPHNDLLNGIASLDGDIYVINNGINPPYINPRYADKNGEEYKRLYDRAMMAIVERHTGIQNAQIESLAKKGIAIKLDDYTMQHLGANLDKQGRVIERGISSGDLEIERMYLLNSNGKLILDVDENPIFNELNTIEMDFVFPGTEGLNRFSAEISGKTFFMQRATKIDRINNGEEIKGYLGIVTEDLENIDPDYWSSLTDIQRRQINNNYNIDIWNALGDLEDLKLNIDEIGGGRWYELIVEYEKLLDEDGELTQAAIDFRNLHSQELWDEMPLEIQLLYRQKLIEMFTKTDGRGLASQFDDAWSTTDDLVQGIVDDILVISGKAGFDPDMRKILADLDDPRLPATYRQVITDQPASTFEQYLNMDPHGRKSGTPNVKNYFREYNKHVLNRLAEAEEVALMDQAYSSALFSLFAENNRANMKSHMDWSVLTEDSPLRSIKDNMKDLIRNAKKSNSDDDWLVVGNSITDLFMPINEFETIKPSQLGNSIEHMSAAKYETFEMGGSIKSTEVSTYINAFEPEQLFENIKKWFYIDDAGIGDGYRSTSINGEGYKAVYEMDSDLWERFLKGDYPKSGDPKIRMAKEFRSNSPNSFNIEKMFFKTTENGLNMKNINTHPSSVKLPFAFVMFRLQGAIQNNRKTYTSSSGEVIHFTSKNVPDELIKKWEGVKFVDRFFVRDIKGPVGEYDSLAHFLADNFQFPKNVISHGDNYIFPGKRKSYIATLRNDDTSQRPTMFFSDELTQSLEDSLEFFVKMEGKPSFLLYLQDVPASTVALGTIVWAKHFEWGADLRRILRSVLDGN